MLNQQGFTVVYAHVAQLELEMTPGSLHAVPPANAMPPMPRGRPRASAWRVTAEDMPPVQWPWLDQGVGSVDSAMRTSDGLYKSKRRGGKSVE